MMPLDTPMKQVNIICNILKHSYLETFNNHITEVEDGKEKHALKQEDVEAALEKVTFKGFQEWPSSPQESSQVHEVPVVFHHL